MSLYPKRILCSLYFVLYAILKRLNRIALWLARKEGNLETIHCTDSSVDCTEALKDNQAFASQLQMCSCKSGLGSQKSELSVFLCYERTTAYGGWNLVVEYCQKRPYSGQASRSLLSNLVAKLLVGKNWILPLQLRIMENEKRANMFASEVVASQKGGIHPWVERWQTRIFPLESFC